MKPRFIRRQTPRRAAFRTAVKALALSGIAAGFAPNVFANQGNYWTGTTGDFGNAGLWSLSRVPDGAQGDDANVFNGGTVTIANDGYGPNDVNAGGNGPTGTGDGTYIQTAGTFNVGTVGGWLRLGTSNGTTGTYNLQGGTLNFVGGEVNVGERNGTTGIFNFTGGNFNLNSNNGGHLSVGGRDDPGGDTGGTGTFNFSGVGTLDSNKEIWIGQGPNATGTFNMSGGTLFEHNWLAIGRQSATGTLNLSGGTINKDGSANDGSHITLAGLGTTQTATVNQTGGDVVVGTGGRTIWIGETATGVWNISGGTLQANDNLVLGQDGGNGTLNINPPAAAGGVAPVVTSPSVIMGSEDSGRNFASATVNLNGGTLATNGFVVGAGSGTRTVNFNGGTVQVTTASSDFMGGTSITSLVGNGGAIFDTNGNDTTITGPLAHDTTANAVDGGLTKRGAGLLTLTAGNSYTGPTVVSTGSLVVTGSVGSAAAPAGAVTVAAGANLVGTGTLTLGNGAVLVNGNLYPGATPTTGSLGTLNVTTTGTFTLASTATLRFDINTLTGKDLIMASGAALVIQNGSTLALTVPGNFNYGGTYTLFSGLSGRTGNFTNVTGIANNERPVFTFANGNYNISFTLIPEPSTWALGVFGLGLGALWLRRRVA